MKNKVYGYYFGIFAIKVKAKTKREAKKKIIQKWKSYKDGGEKKEYIRPLINEVDELINQLDEKLEKLLKPKKSNKSDFYIYVPTKDEWISDRRKVFYKIEMQDLLKGYKDEYTNIKIYFIIEVGYFDGVMFDYEIIDDYDEMAGEVYQYTEKTINKIIDIYERLLEKLVNVKLERVATFSNGETIYKQL